LKKYIDTIRKNYIKEQNDKKPLTTGIITKDNEDGTYNIKINESDKIFYDVPTNSYGMSFAVGDGVMIGFEDNQKESPRVMGNSKNIAQTPKTEIVDFSGSPGGGGKQEETVITYSEAINDGLIGIFGKATYAEAHDPANGEDLDDSSDDFTLGHALTTVPSNMYAVYRAFLFFDTSAIPENAIITSAILSIYGEADISDTDFNIVIQNGQPTYPHSTLVLGDFYYGHYRNNGGQLNTSGFSVAGYNNIILNSNGRAWINKGGITKFCLRNSHDIANVAPTDVEAVLFWASEKGEGYKPKLTITYTI